MIYADMDALKVGGTAGANAPEIFNLLVSLPYGDNISALMRKVQTDYRRKTEGVKAIKS